MPDREENLTMVVSRLAGCETPLMLLTNLAVRSQRRQASRALLRAKVGMRNWDSLSQKPGPSRKDADVSLVCDSAFGLAGGMI